MNISSIGSTSTTNYASGTSLDKDAFLQLLVTQLQHQDPMSPVSNEDFLAQLAQFSSVEQLSEINSGTQTGLLMQQSVGNALATGLIGKEVLLDGSVLELKGGEARTLGFSLEELATVSVEIRDADGKLVRTVRVEEGALLEAGEHQVLWDGLDDEGRELADGYYQVALAAVDASGGELSLEPNVSGLVTGIRFAGGVAYLLVGDIEYSLSEVIEVRAPAAQES